MLIIAGLGNPGNKYANNRHNIGFMAVDEIAHRHSFSQWKNKFRSQVTQGEIADEKILLLKPQTMMNLSGEAIGEAMRFYKLNAGDILVLYDELDLEPAKVRFKTGGGAGGHNGIRSIIDHCGEHFQRLRLGIGHPGHKNKVTKHVLGDFSKADSIWLENLLSAIGQHADLLVTGQNSNFMNKLSLAIQQTNANKKPPKKQTHIRQARQSPTKDKTAKIWSYGRYAKKTFWYG